MALFLSPPPFFFFLPLSSIVPLPPSLFPSLPWFRDRDPEQALPLPLPSLSYLPHLRVIRFKKKMNLSSLSSDLPPPSPSLFPMILLRISEGWTSKMLGLGTVVTFSLSFFPPPRATLSQGKERSEKKMLRGRVFPFFPFRLYLDGWLEERSFRFLFLHFGKQQHHLRLFLFLFGHACTRRSDTRDRLTNLLTPFSKKLPSLFFFTRIGKEGMLRKPLPPLPSRKLRSFSFSSLFSPFPAQ